MLRQNTSYRLNQSKIFSSSNRSSSFILEATSCDARTAANLAFSRAQGQGSLMILDPSNDSHSPQNILKASQQTNTNHAQPETKSHECVRFVGPRVVKQRTSTSARSPSIYLQLNRARPIETGIKELADTQCNIPCHSPSTDRTSYMKKIIKSYTTTDICHEYQTDEKNLTSTESSCRRIRKSKSMLSPLKTTDVFYTNGKKEIPGEDPNLGLLASQKLQARLPKIILRASKSTNFIQAKQNHTESNDTAVRLARDRFLNETAQHRLREKPFHIFRSRSHKIQKPYQDQFRKSSRDSEASNVISSSHFQYSRGKDSRFKELATKASKSLRSRLRKRFRWGYDNTFEVPAQQVDAKKTHVRTYNGDSTSAYSNILLASHPDEASFAHVITRIPSIYEADLSDMKSQVGSIKSIKTYSSDEKSPVTSWNSTAVNTVNSYDSLKYHEKGDPSLDMTSKHGIHISNLFPGSDKTKNDASTHNQLSKTAVSNPDPIAISSARVYSALMKRLDAKKSRLKKMSSRRINNSSVSPPKNADESTLSNVKIPGDLVHTTIKKISSEEAINKISKSCELKADDFKIAGRDSDHLVTNDYTNFIDSNKKFLEAERLNKNFIKKDSINDLEKNPRNNQISSQIKKPQCEERISPISSNIYHEKETTGITFNSSKKLDVTAQDIAHEYECLISDTYTLRQNKSTFFGGGTVPIVKTASPLRRAMVEGLCRSNHNSLNQSHEDNSQESDSSCSGSIYSCTTSGQARKSENSKWSLVSEDSEKQRKTQSFSNPTGGDAVIIDQAIYTSKIPNKIHNRNLSSRNSNEWRSWMSSEISRFEREKENRHSGNYNYAILTKNTHSSNTSHIREDAQITNDDIKTSNQRLNMPVKALGVVQQHSQNIRNPQLLHPAQNIKPSKFFDNPRSQSQLLVSTQVTPAPLLEPESHLRTSQSTSSFRSIASINAPSSLNRKPNNSTGISSHKENIPHASLHANKPDTNMICVDNLTLRDTILFSRPSTTYNYGSPNTEGTSSSKISVNSDNRDLMPKSEKNAESSNFCERDWNPVRISEKMDSWPLDLSTVGSKEIVDLFLSKRRKKLTTASEDTDSLFL